MLETQAGVVVPTIIPNAWEAEAGDYEFELILNCKTLSLKSMVIE